MNFAVSTLNRLVEKHGMVEYIRDYYAAINGRLTMLYTRDDFYIAEDLTYQPWLSVMGIISDEISDKSLFDMLAGYVNDSKYIAVYTNIERVAKFLETFEILTYHEDFLVGEITDVPAADGSDIRLATVSDLPFISSTYHRSGYEKLLNRVKAKQMWVLAHNEEIKGYAGIHKDGSLGYEYVSEKFRRQHVATNLQCFVANYMLKNGMIPYVMISKENSLGKNLQGKLKTNFAKNLFYFFAKGKYILE